MTKDRFRDLSKPPRFDQRDPGRTLSKQLAGISKEEAQVMAKRFFALWPEAAKYLDHVREHVMHKRR